MVHSFHLLKSYLSLILAPCRKFTFSFTYSMFFHLCFQVLTPLTFCPLHGSLHVPSCQGHIKDSLLSLSLNSSFSIMTSTPPIFFPYTITVAWGSWLFYQYIQAHSYLHNLPNNKRLVKMGNYIDYQNLGCKTPSAWIFQSIGLLDWDFIPHSFSYLHSLTFA